MQYAMWEWFFLVGTYLSFVQSHSHVFQFDAKGTVNADGRRIIAVNGHDKTYGPDIRIRAGDTVNLQLVNHICSEKNLEDSVHDSVWDKYCSTTLHFHGLIPIGNLNDGVPYLTQDVIGYGGSHWYNFTVPSDVSGTYWYHSHSSVQYGDGLRGFLVVDSDGYDHLKRSVVTDVFGGGHYDSNQVQEELISFSDWYDNSDIDVLHDSVLSDDGTTDPRMDDSLVNGETADNLKLPLKSSTNYLLLRLLNSGTSGTQVFHLEGHKMVLIETDGTMVTPFELETVTLAVGQRVAVMVDLTGNKDQPVKGINGCNKMMGFFTKKIWFVPETATSNIPESKDSISINHLPGFNNNELVRDLQPIDKQQLWDSENLQQIELDYEYFNDQETIEKHGTGMYKINGKTIQEYAETPIDIHNNTDVVELVINSIDHMRHPWHLHGHNFQLVSIGNKRDGPYHPASSESSKASQHYKNDLDYWKTTRNAPIIRDSVNVQGASYAVIRFKPAQVGIWLLHCHFEWHVQKGLGAVFQIKQLASERHKSTGSNTEISQNTTTPNQESIIAVSQEDKINTSTSKWKVLLIYFTIMCLVNLIIYKRFM